MLEGLGTPCNDVKVIWTPVLEPGVSEVIVNIVILAAYKQDSSKLSRFLVVCYAP